MTKREAIIAKARIAGYHNDTASFMRVRVEGRIAIPTLNQAWAEGQRARNAGIGCHCYECAKVTADA